jgi:hypothetical protein
MKELISIILMIICLLIAILAIKTETMVLGIVAILAFLLCNTYFDY